MVRQKILSVFGYIGAGIILFLFVVFLWPTLLFWWFFDDIEMTLVQEVGYYILGGIVFIGTLTWGVWLTFTLFPPVPG